MLSLAIVTYYDSANIDNYFKMEYPEMTLLIRDVVKMWSIFGDKKEKTLYGA